MLHRVWATLHFVLHAAIYWHIFEKLFHTVVPARVIPLHKIEHLHMHECFIFILEFATQFVEAKREYTHPT